MNPWVGLMATLRGSARSVLEAPRARFPAGLIGMLTLVYAAESFVSRHDLDALNLNDWEYHSARAAASRLARGRDVLCFGDSIMKTGVLPKSVEARSGLRVYNLAICGSQAPATYQVFRRALKRGARPSAVVVTYNPILLAQPPQSSGQGLPYLASYLDALELGWRTRDAGFLASLLVRGSLPSLRGRNNLRPWIVESVAGRLWNNRYESPIYLRHWAENQGAMIMPSNPKTPRNDQNYQRTFYAPSWTPNRVNADYLRAFMTLAESRGVTVYWLIPPIVPGLQAAKAAAGFDAKFVTFARTLLARFPNLVVIDGRHADYDPTHFCDSEHLGAEGAMALSEALGDTLRHLRRETPPDRWVELPRYRRRGNAYPVEDVWTAIRRTVETQEARR